MGVVSREPGHAQINTMGRKPSRKTVKPAVNPFAVKITAKKTKSKCRPRKKHYNLEAVDKAFTAVQECPIRQTLVKSNSPTSTVDTQKTLGDVSSVSIHDITKRTAETEIS